MSLEANTSAGLEATPQQSSGPIATIVAVSNTSLESVISGLKASGDTTETASDSPNILHASDLTKEQWAKILKSSGILKAWKGQFEGGNLHINRAPCAAITLKVDATNTEDSNEGLPEFEVADDTYVEVRESKTRLEREMTLKAFTESGIHAALSGGVEGIGLGLGGDISKGRGREFSVTSQESASALHGFYNLPRVIVHLDPDGFQLSAQCERFFAKYEQKCSDASGQDEVLKRFTERFGSVISRRVTLGARLYTTQDLRQEDKKHISEMKTDLRSNINAQVGAAEVGLKGGVSNRKESTEAEQTSKGQSSSRMILETQGGNGLLASDIPKWIDSVASYDYWRTIQQDETQSILSFLAETSQDSGHNSSINQLLKRAELVHQGVRPNYLEIVAKASYVLREKPYTPSPAPPETKLYNALPRTSAPQPTARAPVFQFHLHLSQPKHVHKLTWKPEVRDVALNHSGKEQVKIPSGRGWHRNDIEQELDFSLVSPFEIPYDTVVKKLPQQTKIRFTVELESDMEWDADCDEIRSAFLLDGGVAELYWPDVERNVEIRWELPIRRAVSERRSPFWEEEARSLLAMSSSTDKPELSTEQPSKKARGKLSILGGRDSRAS